MATNSFLRYANSVGKGLDDRFNAFYFDSWQIEAPRFSDNCGKYDPHYSCVRTLNDSAAMVGDVGEAVASAFLHYALHILP